MKLTVWRTKFIHLHANTTIMAKKLIFIALAIALLVGSAFTISVNDIPAFSKSNNQDQFHVGDVVFQTSNSAQSKAIQLATDSKFSHVGMVVSHQGKLMMLEAVQPVKLTPINEFVARGTNGNYVVKKLKPGVSAFSDEKIAELERFYTPLLGKNYDIYFNWSDKELYCSELVWKVYKEVLGIELSKPKPLKSYHLDHPLVKEQMKARYGENLPLNEVMVSPQDLFESDFLQ